MALMSASVSTAYIDSLPLCDLYHQDICDPRHNLVPGDTHMKGDHRTWTMRLFALIPL